MAGALLVVSPADLAADSTESNAPLPPPTVSALLDTQWRLVDFQSMDDAIGTILPSDPSLYTMRLGRDGSVAMRLNCNRALGDWSATPSSDVNSGSFEFGPLAATRALCPPPSMDERIVRDAQFIRSYFLEEGRLYLSLMADGGIYAWEPAEEETTSAVPSSPADGSEEPRNWEVAGVARRVNLRDAPSTDARVVTTLPRGTILDNLGCQPADDRIWCDVQQFGGGPRGYVAAEYLHPAVSPDGTPAYGPDDSALRAGQGLFDATGQVPCAQHPGQPMAQCKFGVARAGGGYATVVVTRPDGRTRALYFRMGKPIGADTSEADSPGPFSATRDADLNRITIGAERYEIPDAVILGG